MSEGTPTGQADQSQRTQPREGTQSLPIVALNDDAQTQTGAVPTLLLNIKKYDDPNTTPEERKELEKMMEQSIPALHKIGMFDLFSPDGWADTESPGRRFIGVKAKELGY